MKRKQFILRNDDVEKDYQSEIWQSPAMLGRDLASNPAAMPNWEVADLDDSDADRLRKQEGALVAPEMMISLCQPLAEASESESPGEPAWGVKLVAGQTTKTGSGIKVAVLDTGIKSDHPVFSHIADDKMVIKDFTSTSATDKNGHGTHCAATIFGKALDGSRVGVAPGIDTALIAKVLDDQGRGSADALFDGLLWASAHGADVVSTSIGFDYPGQIERLIESYNYPPKLAASQALVDFAHNLQCFEKISSLIETRFSRSGCLLVAAAGNESLPSFRVATSLPAAVHGIISVGAIAKPNANELHDVAEFSNGFPDVVAPGVDVLSAGLNDGLVEMTGTSMACPHVAGVAALWWEHVREENDNATKRDVEAGLRVTCRRDVFSADVKNSDRGLGLVTAPQP